MVQSQLSAYSGSDPIWGFVALVGSELFTGEAAVGLDPRVRLFAVDGHIYFAEREDDAAVATRLVNCGAISAMQLARGSVQVGGHDSLARLFQRDATIDRDAVELTVATATESLLASIAQNPVGMPEVFPLRYHSAGLHHWLRHTPSFVADELPEADEAADVDEISGDADPIADEASVLEPAMLELPVLDAPELAPPVLEAPELAPPVLEAPVLGLPTLDAFPAPKLVAEPTPPEWPRVDDEPAWVVPNEVAEVGEVGEVADPVVEPMALPPVVVSITAAELPQLASLSSFQIQPTLADYSPPHHAEQEPVEEQPFDAPLAEPTMPALTAMPFAAPPTIESSSLPKLAAGPMSVKDLKEDLKRAAAASTEPWSSTSNNSGPSNNMAAVQIWEMVDDLFEDPNKQDVSVGGGAPDERRSWRHNKS